jgi:hypothetical protein
MFINGPFAPLVLFTCALLGSYAAAAETPVSHNWNAEAAAHYLDNRAAWWETWPAAQRDHQTVCVSCHTILPYALSREAGESQYQGAAFMALAAG